MFPRPVGYLVRWLGIAVACSSLWACDSKRPSIGGQVFIVTASGESVKLGLVTVGLFDAERIQQHVADRDRAYHDKLEIIRAGNAAGSMQNARDNQTRDSLRSEDLARLKEALKEAEAELARNLASQRAAVAAVQQAEESYLAAYSRAVQRATAADIAKGLGEVPEKLDLDRAKANRDTADGVVSKQKTRIGTLRSQIAHPATNLLFEPESPPELDSDWYFQGLPSAIQTTETDADGKFELTAPKPGEYVLAARSERDLGLIKESYFWLIRVSADKSRQEILLSNSTMTNSGSPRSLLHVAR